jgi:hypothetical protein
MRIRMMPELPDIGDCRCALMARIAYSQAIEFRAKFDGLER